MQQDSITIEDRVITIVAEKFGVDKLQLSRDTDLVADLDADSLDNVELTIEAEEVFEIAISDEEAEKVRTIGDAVNLVTEQLDLVAQLQPGHD